MPSGLSQPPRMKAMPQSSLCWPKRDAASSTLLEMLVAIAIFATLSLGAYQVLQGVLTSDEVAKRKEARLSELQLAFSLLERDVTQMVPRLSLIHI